MNKKQKTVVLGVTGGIAVFKVLDLIRILRKKKVETIVIMTKSATQMMSPREFEKASGNKVYTTLFEKDFDYRKVLQERKVDHIVLADTAALFVVVPATANSIGKLAAGIADDFLTTTLLATQAPVLICPSMNVHMWTHPLVQKNVAQLKSLGYQFIHPDKGELACGYNGEGRLPTVQTIAKEIQILLKKNDSLAGKRILVTAGGTTEKIDDIRVITNRSSGKMGVALAESCYLRGATVTLFRAKSSVASRYPIHEELFETAGELEMLFEKYAQTADICYHTAAVSDFSVKTTQGKITSNNAVSLQLTPREKVYKKIKDLNSHIFLITFKAEWQKSNTVLIKEAKARLENSSMDGIVANDVSKKNQGFGVDTNAVIVILKNGNWKKLDLKTKKLLADEIVEYTQNLQT